MSGKKNHEFRGAMNCDVAVVGGGPSGLQTARLLASGGLRVVLLEAKPAVGADVICTGIVGREIFSEFDLPDGSVLRDLRSMTIIGPAGRPLAYEHPSPFARVVDRARFDRDLGETAAAAGADLRTGTRVVSAEVTNDGVRLRTQGPDGEPGSISGSVLVLATGIQNHLQKELGLSAPESYLSGIQWETTAGPEMAPSLYVGKEVAPGAFGWAIPTEEGRMKVGLITDRDPREPFRRLLRIFRPGGVPPQEGDIRIKPISQGLAPRTSAPRVLVVGEAAGQVKTTTGGGIAFGLLGARVASDVILKAFRTGGPTAAAFAEYDRLWRAVLEREILVGSYVRRAFAVLDDERIEKLLDVARSDGVIPLIRAKGHFDWHSGLIVDLLRKAPVFRIFREVGLPPASLKKFWS
ncbi:MAG: NAD(P)/FAD-dependent oxidoreductase [Acidobacteriota bacterium]|nr:NAD(P)/FAD-dependent oxidoreductase [Acidobacteriota bacterium]